MDAKQHHRARGVKRQVDRLDALCSAISMAQQLLTPLATPGVAAKLTLEFNLQDGYVDGVISQGEKRFYKINRQAA